MFDFDATGVVPSFGWALAASAGLAAMHEAQRRNLDAIVSASRTALTGYRTAGTWFVERCTASMAESRNRLEAMQGRPLDAGSAAMALSDASAAFERGLAEMHHLIAMADAATADALAILRLRALEAAAELRQAARPA